MPKSKILAAIGRIPEDLSVLKRAIEVSQVQDAGLHLVHVLDLPGDPSDIGDASTYIGQAALAARDRIDAAHTQG